MNISKIFPPNTWQGLSKKVGERILHLRYAGIFTEKIADLKKMRLVTVKEVDTLEGSIIKLYWLVDPIDGIIADAKFQALGPIALIAAADILCEEVMRKNYDQASRISADILDRSVRDRRQKKAFPSTCDTYLNQVISALDKAASLCTDIPIAKNYETTPIMQDMDVEVIDNWVELEKATKMAIVEKVIEREIAPYIALDAGGISLIDIQGNSHVHIAYEGACTSCHAATGSTLSAIQNILQTKVHPSIEVVPIF